MELYNHALRIDNRSRSVEGPGLLVRIALAPAPLNEGDRRTRTYCTCQACCCHGA